MENTMKKVLFFTLVFGLLMGGCSITIPGLLTVDYPGGTTSEGVAQSPLDGVWFIGRTSHTIRGTTGVWSDTGEAWLRDLTKTGDLTWTATVVT